MSSEWPDDTNLPTSSFDVPCTFPDDPKPPSESDSSSDSIDHPDLVQCLVQGIGSKAVGMASTVCNYWYRRRAGRPPADSVAMVENDQTQTNITKAPPPSCTTRKKHNVNLPLVLLSSLVLGPAIWSTSLSSRPLNMRLKVFAALTMIYSLLAMVDQASPASNPPVQSEVKGKVPEAVPGTTPSPESARIPASEVVHPSPISQGKSEAAPVMEPAAKDVPASEPAPVAAAVAPAPLPQETETPKDVSSAEGAQDTDAALGSDSEADSIGFAVVSVSDGLEGDGTVTPSSASADVFEDSLLTHHETPPKVSGPIDRGYHPAELHPRDASYSSPASSASPTLHCNSPSSSPSASMKEKSHGYFRRRTVSSHSTASQDSGSVYGRRKVKFFDKVRGEAKVIVGKIGHNEKLEEEGKRILHGEDH